MAIEPKTKDDQERMGDSLTRLVEEDPTFKARYDQETGQTIISGMGELHLEIIVDRMLREFNVQANVGRPEVAYKETITQPSKAEGRFVRQTGGRGQFGVVELEAEPLPPGVRVRIREQDRRRLDSEGVHHADRAGDQRGTGYRRACRLSGHRREGDSWSTGSYHPVDSSELAFKMAGSLAHPGSDEARQASPA